MTPIFVQASFRLLAIKRPLLTSSPWVTHRSQFNGFGSLEMLYRPKSELCPFAYENTLHYIQYVTVEGAANGCYHRKISDLWTALSPNPIWKSTKKKKAKQFTAVISFYRKNWLRVERKSEYH